MNKPGGRRQGAQRPRGPRRGGGGPSVGALRVVAGTLKGRRLDAPGGDTTRPTGDRIREAVFNSLASMDVIDGARFVDLFAGSGAMGIEALSRGAAEVVFVDNDCSALDVVRSNVASCGVAGRSVVIAGDWRSALDGVFRRSGRGTHGDGTNGSADGSSGGAGSSGAADADANASALVVIADPPYVFDRWGELLEVAHAGGVDVVVAESDRAVYRSVDTDGGSEGGSDGSLGESGGAESDWIVAKEHRYGATVVTVLRRNDVSGPALSE